MHRKFLAAALLSGFALALTAPTVQAEGTDSPPTTATTPEATEVATATTTTTAKPYTIGERINANDVPALRNIVEADTVLRFMGDEYGLNSFFLTTGDKGQILYITPDGQGILRGALFGGDGSSVTLRQISRLKNEGNFDPTPYISRSEEDAAKQKDQAQAAPSPRPDPAVTANAAPNSGINAASVTTPTTPGEKLFQEANNASWIAFGNPASPMITTFMDPSCDHCHKFFQQIYPLVEQGKLYLRVIPVTVIDPLGMPRLVNVYSSTSPAQAWLMITKGTEPPLAKRNDPRANAAIEGNNTLFTRWNLPGTPYSVYRSKDGAVKVLYSTPKDLAPLLSDLNVQ